MSIKTITTVLASDVATSDTFTVTYPTGTNAAWFKGGVVNEIAALGAVFRSPEDFGVTTYGNTTATITWRNAATLPAGTTLRVGLDAPGGRWLDEPPAFTDPSPNRVSTLYPVRISLGAPIVADVDGVATALPTSGSVTLDGARVTDGVAVFDVPRNMTVTPPTGITVTANSIKATGTDVFGEDMIETGPQTAVTNGTTISFAKAFKEISAVEVALTLGGTITTATVGFGDVLGLPVHLPAAAFINAELEDGAAASAGTVVAGLSPVTASTATTADVRGTYDPASAADGSKVFELLVNLSDPTHKGNPQYDG